MKKSIISIAIAGLFMSLACCTATTPKKSETDKNAAETVAVADAMAWLSLVDNQQYSESWEESAQFFKNAIKEQQWVQTLELTRKPLGKTISRELKSKSYVTNVPRAPRGEYVIIEFNSSFEYRKTSVETVTTMLEQDGKWIVSGYFMR